MRAVVKIQRWARNWRANRLRRGREARRATQNPSRGGIAGSSSGLNERTKAREEELLAMVRVYRKTHNTGRLNSIEASAVAAKVAERMVEFRSKAGLEAMQARQRQRLREEIKELVGEIRARPRLDALSWNTLTAVPAPSNERLQAAKDSLRAKERRMVLSDKDKWWEGDTEGILGVRLQ
jgi:hypothetical protein